ncbi:MAG: epoxyqueuosine reductase [Candidatus Azotimanducaceae bacterium]|jgi:epoxyqueuosine reductase
MDEQTFELPDAELVNRGLNLQAAVELNGTSIALPTSVAGYSHLLVFGHGGQNFWGQVSQRDTQTVDPLDTYSVECVADFLKRREIKSFEFIYPAGVLRMGDAQHIDLRRLGRALGWQFDSPLGIGIHPQYGLWFGYRVVVAVSVAINAAFPFDKPLDKPPNEAALPDSHPCDSCSAKPCVAACPVGAVGESFNLTACVNHRVQPGSECARQCLARAACPVGAEHQYTEAQVQYHYDISLNAIREFADAPSKP